MPTAGSPGSDDQVGQPLPPAVTRWPAPANDDAATPAPPFQSGASAGPVTAALPPALEPAGAEPALPWDDGGEEGVVEPAFQESVNATAEGRIADARKQQREEFPVEAFIIPEDTRRVPTGLDPAIVEEVKHHTNHPPRDPAHDLADRFEKVSRRLRAEDLDSLLPSLARGDRFDALLAGFLAGYFSAKEEL